MGIGLRFWQHMAAEAATWIAAQKKAQAILADDDDDTADDETPETLAQAVGA